MSGEELRALHYVQEEVRRLSQISLTKEGRHALMCFKIMLREVWGKEYHEERRTFVFIAKEQP